ncbi:fluoride efflux transporter CrcB [Desulfogranum japonicum]|uniref:fluoride efflux transporter CrcB n=1 Tax=Desulfogranum japonicum TaxID=231447 RepID=UPI0003FB1CA6|nr:fluoride efflux transporter CrcB [Desulfogranum japonicum]
MDSVIRLCIIGAGGFVGAIGRYLVSGWVQNRSDLLLFPIGTMAVNLIGCFCIGFLTMLVETRSFFSVEIRSFLLIGMLGAFTTFSTFGNETLMLMREGRFDLAAFNSVVQVVIGVAMVWMGRAAAGIIWR